MRRLILILALCALVLSGPASAMTVERVTSPGGIEAWLVQDHTNPLIAVEIGFEGGASRDPADRPGLATLAAGLLDEGAGPMDSQAFQGRLEALSISLHFDAGADVLSGHVKTLSTHRDEAFSLLRLALTQPRFDKEPMERVKGQILTQLVQESQSPNAIAKKAWMTALFPDHAYGRPIRGTPEGVKAITRKELQSFAKAHLARSAMTIGVVGDITPAALGALLDATFGGLPERSGVAPLPEAKPVAHGSLVVIDRANPQTVAMFGGPGLKRNDPDWYPAYVMNYILGGGGFSSRLTEEVREKRGLAYSVYSYLAPLRHAGILMGGVATENGRFGQSLDLISTEFRRMRDEGPSDKELADAKTYLNGSFPLSLESSEAIAGLLVQMQRDRLGMDFLDRRAVLIDAVTREDAMRAAKRLLDPEGLTVVAVGRPANVTPRAR